MREKVGEFQAGSEDGQVVVVCMYQVVLDVSTPADPGAVKEGLTDLETAQGEAVKRCEKGKYVIVSSGLVLTSHDPKAP